GHGATGKGPRTTGTCTACREGRLRPSAAWRNRCTRSSASWWPSCLAFSQGVAHKVRDRAASVNHRIPRTGQRTAGPYGRRAFNIGCGAAFGLTARTAKIAGGTTRAWREPWMMFVDGENLTLRAQEIAQQVGMDLTDSQRFPVYLKDVYFWPP